MKKLYLDCDGVILDTINKSYQMLKEEGITTEPEVRKFYSNICWKTLIKESGEIDDSIAKIKELNKYFNIEILTHVNSTKEEIVKKNYFKNELPGINVIAVPREIRKADFVEAKNNILVDDFSENLDYWKEKGGISVKFSNIKENCDYDVITNLLELINLFENNKIEVKE